MLLTQSQMATVALLASQLVLANCGSSRENEISDDPSVVTTSTAPARSLGISKASIHSEEGWVKRPVVIHLTRSAPPRIADALEQAIAAWNDGLGMKIVEYGGRADGAVQTDLYSPLDDDKTIVYFDTQWAAHTQKPETTLATTVWENALRTPAISKGDIILNAETYIFQDSTLPPLDANRPELVADTVSVMVHELGHLLGLDHVARSVDPDSVMHAQTVIGVNEHRRIPSPDDIELMLSIYNP